jgi:hypothetical protein
MMATLSPVRKQRLRTLEKSIRGTMEQFVETGNALKEIRDDELYREDGFETWDAYLKQRVGDDFGIERSQVQRLINASIIRPKLPDAKILPDCSQGIKQEWSVKAVKEFERLAPQDPEHAQRRDLTALRMQDVQRVAKAAVEIAKEQRCSNSPETESLHLGTVQHPSVEESSGYLVLAASAAIDASLCLQRQSHQSISVNALQAKFGGRFLACPVSWLENYQRR